MPSVSVLYLNDPIVGPHLELLRAICEPQSRSRPHITVRYFDKLDIPEEYLTTEVHVVDILSPGAFGLDSEWRQRNRTVFLRCDIEQLLAFEHKPHFPSSFFHVTVYDGKSLSFARQLLQVMGDFSWNFRVFLPGGTTLSRVDLRSRTHRNRKPRTYPDALHRLWHQITNQDLTEEYLLKLSDEERLTYVDRLCSQLHAATRGAEVNTVLQEAWPEPVSDDDATVHDVHLTPPELADAIAEYSVDQLPAHELIRFGDPAVGNGAFYGALKRRVPPNRLESAVGVDISPSQVASAHNRWAHRGMEVMLGDYLHMGELAPRNLILANPPYRRHQKIEPKYKAALRERASLTLGMRVSGQAGLYVYFMLLAHNWLEDGGVGAWLVPSEFMQTRYGAALRYYLAHHVRLIRIHCFDTDQPLFETAKVLPVLVVFRKEPARREHQVSITVGGSIRAPLICDSIPVATLRTRDKWVFPLSDENNADTDANPVRLGALFTVRRGIATGANDFFILTREQAQLLGIPESSTRPVLPKARAIKGDIVPACGDGWPDVHPQLCVIDSDRPLDEIKKCDPHFAAYLEEGAATGVVARALVKSRRPWYRQERRPPARFLCTYMGRGTGDSPPIRFILNRSKAIVTNTYLMLYPHPALAQALSADPEREIELLSLLRETAWRSLREIGRVHAGGMLKVEPRDLEELPLVGLPSWLFEAADLRLDNRPPGSTR